jgi:two-component system cell cycle response regulator DivK
MRKIAVIEDAKDNRDLLYFLLRDEFKVMRYSSGEEALGDFEQDAPDLIVLDIWLPGMDGIEVLKQLRQDTRLCGIPVLALTANAMIGDREKYLAAGFDEYVPKPIINIDEFVDTIRRILGIPQDGQQPRPL